MGIALYSNTLAIIQEHKENPQHYEIIIDGFPYNSDANRRANYRYKWTNRNIDIVATFMQEAMFDKNAIWSSGEKGLCQLLPNKTNNVWLKNENRSNGDYQAKICLEKRNAVEDKNKIWSAYKYRERQVDKIKIIKNKKV